MDTCPLTAAIARGDEYLFLTLLAEVPDAELSGPTGTALLETVARTGWVASMSELVAMRGVDALLPWAGGVDPVEWAVRRGRVDFLRELLHGIEDPTPPDSPHRRALRIAEEAIAADPGAPVSWRGVVTAMERELGVHRAPEVLMARALVRAAPGSGDWDESVSALAGRADLALFRWACDRVSDAPSVAQRRFALDVLHLLGRCPPDDPFEDRTPFTAADARAFLRPLLETEDDPYALRSLLNALAAHGWDDAPTALRHAGHPDPAVRLAAVRVPWQAVADGTDHPGPGTPEVRAVLTGLLADPDTSVRARAAGTLALYGDPRGRAALDGIRCGLVDGGGWEVRDVLYRVRTYAPPPVGAAGRGRRGLTRGQLR
ncbi:HEAT repeat domain-containing protein [Kitasatospora phosalacinea]|uniref:HEAT repeat domain-containing protein n=1 Tax=Kitasatospora phosalacinea TaxID=2065 RepID=A0A9W6ULI8_9ACTN|nr:HEAT repeat domain-containing protein [Kitasatospora phosalacinea]GLW52212.1 hypothetical protein Kpho01_02230 [Kitasatospora phosalacinea]